MQSIKLAWMGRSRLNAHVAKPIQMDKLKAAIRQVMEAHNTSAAGQKI